MRVFSWALYDFANTIFSMNIITLYFALWITVDKGGEDILYSIAFSISMILSAFLEPVLGAYSDYVGRRKPFMVFFTVLCCISTALIGMINQLFLGLLFFIVVNLGFQLAAVFYTAILSNISHKGNIGRISGLGVGLGYVGTIVGLLMVKPFVNMYGRQGAFIPTAVLFFTFSLPAIFYIKEDASGRIALDLRSVFEKPWNRIKQTFAEAQKLPEFKSIFCAGLAFFAAVNTTILFMGVYTKKAMGFSQNEIIFFFIGCTVFAIVSAFCFGFLVDRSSAFRAFKLVLFLWIIGLLLVLCSTNKLMFWIAGIFIGVCLSATWVVSRVMIIAIFPTEKLGEIFGLMGLISKLSAIIGSLIWGGIVWGFGFLGVYKYRIAIGVQVMFMIFALFAARDILKSIDKSGIKRSV